jgi:hypothetical protein
MGDGYSNISDIIGNNTPVQQFSQIGGGDGSESLPQQQPVYTNTNYNYGGGFHFTKKLLMYISFFIATAIMTFQTPRAHLLQYIPNAYTAGGVLSLTGVGALSAAAVIVSYLVSIILSNLI